MNCFNGERFIKRAIDSVYSQTFKSWEIIFWDNLSTDNSALIAKQYNYKLRYFKSKTHTVLGDARNQAIKKARGEFVAFLDCDDLWMPNKLEKQIPLFNNKKIGLVYSDAIYFTENGSSFNLYDRYSFFEGKCFSQLLKNYFLCLPTVIVRASTLIKLNHVFDCNLLICEEMDLFLRVAYISELAIINEQLAGYCLRPDSLTNSKIYLINQEIELIIGNLMKISPSIGIRYKQELLIFKLRYLLSSAKRLYFEGKVIEARSKIQEFSYLYKIKLYLLFSYIPYQIPKFLYLIIKFFRY